MAENTGGATSTSRLLRAEDGRGDSESERGGASGRPREPWKGEFVKSIVYAGLDAIVTCFSLISSISASRYSSGDELSHLYFLFFVWICYLLAKMKFIKMLDDLNYNATFYWLRSPIFSIKFIQLYWSMNYMIEFKFSFLKKKS